VTGTSTPTKAEAFVSALLALAALAGAAGCRSKAGPSRDTFTRGMQAYVAARGDLCISRATWPVDVSENDVAIGTNDAVQMPVLERLGLVRSQVLPVRVNGVATPLHVRRYQLTSAGREHYLDRRTREPMLPDDPAAARHGDFCVLRLALGQVESWEVQKNGAAPPTAVVSYTYTVDAPAWTNDAGFRKAFPAVARLIGGAGSAQLVEGFTLTADGWTANELLLHPPSASRPSSSAQAAAP
jgi:hypothetical protein